MYFNTETGQTKTGKQWADELGLDGFYKAVKDGVLIEDDATAIGE